MSGDLHGFFEALPTATVTIHNQTHATVQLSAVPGYRIDAAESLDLYTSLHHMFGVSRPGSQHIPDSFYPDTPRLVATISVQPAPATGSAPGDAATAVVVVGGVGGMASEVQVLGAVALMNCADPQTKKNFGSFRVLSPAALSNSYSGVVLGNAVLVAGVAVLQAVVLCAIHCCGRVSQLENAQALARFPSLTLLTAATLHVGTGFASSQLVSSASEFEAWEVGVGALGIAYCVAFPVFLALHPYYRVERAFQDYEVGEWLAAKGWPAWLRFVLPRGAVFSVETRRAYGPVYVSAFRSPPTQVWWTSLSAWTGTVMCVGGLFHPTSAAGCQAQFAVMGLALAATGVAVCVFRPLRTHSSNVLNCCARVCSGGVLVCMSASLNRTGTTNEMATVATLSLGCLLMALTCVGLLLGLFAVLVENMMVDDSIMITLLWTHLPTQANSKLTQQFMMATDHELLEVAQTREIQVIDEDSLDDAFQSSSSSSPGGSSDKTVHTQPRTFARERSSSSDNASLFLSDCLCSDFKDVENDTVKPKGKGASISNAFTSSEELTFPSDSKVAKQIASKSSLRTTSSNLSLSSSSFESEDEQL